MTDQIFIVSEGDLPMSTFQGDPADLADLLLLAVGAALPGTAEKIHHLLADVRAGIVFHTLAEPLFQGDGQPGFLPDFPKGGFHLGLAVFHMAFGERPVPAEPVLEQQQFNLPVFEPVDQGPAGFLSTQETNHHLSGFFCAGASPRNIRPIYPIL